ncbi:MAG: nucleoside deaminase [Pyrinomonadaceae bacterium]
MEFPEIRINYPAWVEPSIDPDRRYGSDDEKIQLAIDLSRENVVRDTGGPFGAAIFEAASNRLVAVGVNLVVPLNNCTLHGEMVAIMMAGARLKSWTLAGEQMPRHELFTSCEPCAMCLGATLWSGVKKLVFAATREDALRHDFDEGPVFPESYAYLERRGIEIVRALGREQANEVLDLYEARRGPVYNG